VVELKQALQHDPDPEFRCMRAWLCSRARMPSVTRVRVTTPPRHPRHPPQGPPSTTTWC
jgi:hypothetical protein